MAGRPNSGLRAARSWRRPRGSKLAPPARRATPATPTTPAPPPRDITLTILAQDPAVLKAGTTRILRADVAVPYDEVLAGPRSSRFAVVDYDATRNELHPPTDIATKPAAPEALKNLTDAQLVANRASRAPNVYAIAARTLAAFEFALGRRIPWSFAGHQLNHVPAAFEEPIAYCDAESNAILFGWTAWQMRQRPAMTSRRGAVDAVARRWQRPPLARRLRGSRRESRRRCGES
jgi:hypothetical protein